MAVRHRIGLLELALTRGSKLIHGGRLLVHPYGSCSSLGGRMVDLRWQLAFCSIKQTPPPSLHSFGKPINKLGKLRFLRFIQKDTTNKYELTT